MSSALASITCSSPPLPNCLTGLLETLSSCTEFDAADAASMLRTLDINASALTPWQDFNHPAHDSYGRRLIARGAHYELMLMSWVPGDYSAIHDHGIAEWGAVRYFGDADHILFRERQGVLSVRERMTMHRGDVCPVGPSLIHLMGNPTKTPFVSLHLYGRSQAAADITGGARIFDFLENCVQRTNGGVFFCLPEHDILSREPGPTPDDATRLLHHELMLSRVNHMLASNGGDTDLENKATGLRRHIQALRKVTVTEVTA